MKSEPLDILNMKMETKILNQGISPCGVPFGMMPAPAFGVEIKKKKRQVPKYLPISFDECVDKIGIKESVVMNFVPQMLTSLALEQAMELVGYCRDNRLSEYKRHTREIRNCYAEYNRELAKGYGRAMAAYQHYMELLYEAIDIDLFKCWCTFTNEAARQYVGHPHKEIPARIAMVRMMLNFVEKYDKNVDKIISEKMDTHIKSRRDPYCLMIHLLCTDIAETFGHELKFTETMEMCVKVLANKCHSVALSIVAGEDAVP